MERGGLYNVITNILHLPQIKMALCIYFCFNYFYILLGKLCDSKSIPTQNIDKKPKLITTTLDC